MLNGIASDEAARRYFSTKEFVYNGKKVFSIKDVRPDNKFLDQDPPANWVVLNDAPLQSQIELFGDFPIATRFDIGEPRLLITVVDIAEGVAVTFDSYKKADGKRKTVYCRKYGARTDPKNSAPIPIATMAMRLIHHLLGTNSCSCINVISYSIARRLRKSCYIYRPMDPLYPTLPN